MSLYKHYIQRKDAAPSPKSGPDKRPGLTQTAEGSVVTPVANGGEAAGTITFQQTISTQMNAALEGARKKRGLRSRAETIRVLLSEALAKG